MLQLIRDNATGWIAWGIVILISVPFALWGIHQYVTPDSSVAVATVEDAEIGYYDFQRLYARRRQQLQSILGAGLIDTTEDNRLRRDVLDGMIDSEVLIRSGMTAGMRVGDEQLASTIQTQGVFQSGDGFSQDAYESWLRSQGYSPGGFEEDLRRSLLEQQIALGVSRSDFISAGGLRDAVRIRLQKRTFSLLTIPAADFESPEPAESEIAAQFEQHRSEYTASERLRLRYLEISMDEIASDIKADDEELRALFEAERERFVTPEKREVSHILISVLPMPVRISRSRRENDWLLSRTASRRASRSRTWRERAPRTPGPRPAVERSASSSAVSWSLHSKRRRLLSHRIR